MKEKTMRKLTEVLSKYSVEDFTEMERCLYFNSNAGAFHNNLDLIRGIGAALFPNYYKPLDDANNE